MSLSIEVFRGGPLDNGTYVLYDAELGIATVVDPSFESERIWPFLAERKLRLEAIVHTHGHFDHMAGTAALRKRAPEAPIYLHPLDSQLLATAHEQAAFLSIVVQPAPTPDRWFAAGQEVTLAGERWQVLHVPGHSPGSVGLYAPGAFLGGDVLFRGSVGRTDIPEGHPEHLLRSLQQVLLLPDETVVYPGHGPLTSIGWERKSNPFLR